MIIILCKLFGIFKELITAKTLTHEGVERNCALRHVNRKKQIQCFCIGFCVEENNTRE